jgi:hypothetical protein
MAKSLDFYDLKEKRSFSTNKYRIERRFVKGNLRRYAVAKSPYGEKKEYWRVVSKDFKR